MNESNIGLTLQQAEAGQFPGVILQMTYWYRPDEMSLRLLYFCKRSNELLTLDLLLLVDPSTHDIIPDICGNISHIFGGLLAYAFDTVSGAGGLSGWQW